MLAIRTCLPLLGSNEPAYYLARVSLFSDWLRRLCLLLDFIELAHRFVLLILSAAIVYPAYRDCLLLEPIRCLAPLILLDASILAAWLR